MADRTRIWIISVHGEKKLKRHISRRKNKKRNR